MSKECIYRCPRIDRQIEDINPELYAPVMVEGVLEACQNSYDCPGPTKETQEVTVGLFKRRQILRDVYICGLDQEPPVIQ